MSDASVVGGILLVGRLAAATPHEQPAANGDVEIAPVDIEPARLDTPAPSLPTDLVDLPEVAHPVPPDASQPEFADPATFRRGRNLMIASIAGAVPMAIGVFFMIGEQMICSLNDISWDGYRDDDADKLIHCPPSPPGPILIGLGGTTFLTLMATGGALRAKAKRSKRVQALVPTPSLSHQGGAVAWVLRF